MTVVTGATRHVVLIGHLAIKIPSCCGWKYFLHGLLANMQERVFAKANWDGLCPILFSVPGGWLVVMRRARVMTDEEFENFDYKNFVEREEYHLPAEEKPDCFGWLDGRIVVIDYGGW